VKEYVRGAFDPREYQGRLLLFVAVVVLVAAGIVFRLWQLQVLDGDTHAKLSLGNTRKEREMPAQRGLILAAGGERLAEGGAAYDLMIRPSEVPDRGQALQWDDPPGVEQIAARVASLIPELEAQAVRASWEQPSGRARNAPSLILHDLSWDQVARLRANAWALEGIEVLPRPVRVYPHGALTAHAVGYLREVQPDRLKELRMRYAGQEPGQDWYELGDLIGTYGLEAKWEESLKGHDGREYRMLDVAGRELAAEVVPPDLVAHLQARRVAPVAGHNVETTLRMDLQERAAELMGEESGAVVMVEVHTGRVLVYLSLPSFDPSIFARRLSPETWAALRDDPDHPLVDKPVQAIYPPGSTYKVFVAAAARSAGLIDESFSAHCRGTMRVGNETKRCWRFRSGGHGYVDLHRAIVESCDVFFYKLAVEVGIDPLAEAMAGFGFGEDPGLEINHGRPGILPSTTWLARSRGLDWQLGDTASALIGQGYSLVTPMQLAVATATLVNGGRRWRPRIVERVVDSRTGRALFLGEREQLGTAELSADAAGAVRAAMVGVVEEPGGTARRQRMDDLSFGGKTGTAQVVRQTVQDLAAGRPDKHLRDHALFVAFAPADAPRVAVAVVVEHGEHGSTAAAPVARGLLEAWWQAEAEVSP
jgi:penicillin-binding protein 2